MDKIFNNPDLYRAVESAVDKWLSSLSSDVDPVTLDIISRKYHALGASLVQDAYLLTRDTVRNRPWLPVTLVDLICKTINHCGIKYVSSPDSHQES